MHLKRMADSKTKNPVILISDGSIAAFSIFNPNDWNGESKPIIASCAAQYSLLLFATSALAKTYEGANQVCQARMGDLSQQWRRAPWDLQRGSYFVEIPAVHLSIQAFLSTVKTLLDLLAQLLSSERLVHVKLHGFHKKGQSVGGEVLHALAHKKNPQRAEIAARVREYLTEQKAAWIDGAVSARDNLAHAVRGMPQVMWELEISNQGDSISCDRIVPPHIGDEPFEQYSHTTAAKVEMLSTTILQALRTA